MCKGRWYVLASPNRNGSRVAGEGKTPLDAWKDWQYSRDPIEAMRERAKQVSGH